MSYRDTQNPGIGGIDEITDAEAEFIQALAALSYAQGDILYHNGTTLTRLPKGTALQQLRINAGETAPEWFSPAAGSLDGSGTTNEIVYWVDSDTIGALAVATYPSLTELAYVKGVTSAIQTQLNAKLSSADAATTYQPLDADLTTIAGLTATTDNFIVSVASAWASRTPAQVRTTLGIGTAGLVATDLADLNEATIEAAIDTLANLTSIQGRTITLADAGADAILGWDDSANAYENLTQAEVLAVIGDAAADGATKGVSSFTAADFNAAAGVISIDYTNGQKATTGQAGFITELATQAETNAGSDTTRAVTPNSLAAAKRTIVLSAAGGAPTTTIGCGGPTKVEAGTNDIDYYVLEFDTTTEERAFWVVVMPDNYDGSTVIARFIWTNAAGLTTETVTWGIKARAYADSDAIDQAYGTEVTVADTWLAQGDIHISSDTSAITIGGSPAGGRPVVFNVGRKTASDNMTGDARLIAVHIEYGINAYSD